MRLTSKIPTAHATQTSSFHPYLTYNSFSYPGLRKACSDPGKPKVTMMAAPRGQPQALSRNKLDACSVPNSPRDLRAG